MTTLAVIGILLVAATELDRTGRREDPTLELSLLDPSGRTPPRRLATLPATGWGSFSFSPDDQRLAMLEYKSVNESYVWVMELATGERKRVLPAAGTVPPRPIASGDLEFAGDGRGLFLTTDRDAELARLAYLDIASGRLEYFGTGGDWDAESIALSLDKKTLAVVSNEAGASVLRLYDAATRAGLPLPQRHPLQALVPFSQASMNLRDGRCGHISQLASRRQFLEDLTRSPVRPTRA